MSRLKELQKIAAEIITKYHIDLESVDVDLLIKELEKYRKTRYVSDLTDEQRLLDIQQDASE